MEKKKKKKSLYIYLSISFIEILIFILISTFIYFLIFSHIRVKGSLTFQTLIENNIINKTIMKEIGAGLRSALVYSSFFGIALIFVVANHIINPIRKITEATKKVASGDLNVEVNIKNSDEIGELADNFNLMVKELNSIEYLRKDFISNVSHELKTPIASIQGFTKLLNDENISPEEKKEYIEIILEETNRLSNLSTNMLKLSKLENQKMITNKKEYRLDNQLRKAIVMLEENMNKKNIIVSLSSKEISIIEDENLIMEIWINLLNNAIKYSKENGKIDVTVNEEDNFVKVLIKDNGIGIPKEKQGRIFEKFYQAEKSHSMDGTGLGLAIVKRIVDMVEGKISFTSEQDKGTTFEIVLKKNI